MTDRRIAYVRAAKHAGLRQRDALLESVRDLNGEPQDVFTTLRSHGLIGLLLSSLTDSDLRTALSGPLLEQLDAWRAKPRPSSETLLHGFAKARDILARASVPALLLKGCYFAERLYGGIGRRPQFDVDVLVHERDFRRAIRALIADGFEQESYDLHARTLTVDDWKLDVHRCLRRAPAFRLDERMIWSSAVEASAGSLTFRTLSDEWNLVLLVLGAFEDLGQGMVKLRQLLDLYLLLRAIDEHFRWEDFLGRRAPENLEDVCVAILQLVMDLFQARAELPRLAAILSDRSDRGALLETSVVDLVFAPRKSPANFVWFATIYPGSVRLYLLWFWYGGFPSNLRTFDARRLTASLSTAFGGNNARA